ncbi:MAG: hypothetical protein ACR2MY_08640 [Candidatus Dormibacteria bacterium]
MSETNHFPNGWDAERVTRLIDHYDHLADDEAAAEDEAAFEDDSQVFIEVPKELVSEVRDLISRRKAS